MTCPYGVISLQHGNWVEGNPSCIYDLVYKVTSCHLCVVTDMAASKNANKDSSPVFQGGQIPRTKFKYKHNGIILLPPLWKLLSVAHNGKRKPKCSYLYAPNLFLENLYFILFLPDFNTSKGTYSSPTK